MASKHKNGGVFHMVRRERSPAGTLPFMPSPSRDPFEILAEARRRIAASGPRLDLRELELTTQMLAVLLSQIASLTALQSLDLDGNQLTTLPPEIGALTALRSLDLHSNHLTTLPPEIGAVTALHTLDLNDNDLTTLPPEIGSLTALETLSLRGNRLATLPPEIGSLTALQRLKLNNNQLTTLPPEIGCLTALQTLELGSNELVALPQMIGSLQSLQVLHLFRNKLTMLPREIACLTRLRELSIETNQFTVLPPEIGSLTALETLHLSGNRITTLPPELASLTALQTLHLGSNRLAILPPEIGSLTALRTLFLNNNQLATLPSEIGSLTELQSLYLNENELTTLPESLGQLASKGFLKKLQLHDNPGLGLADELLGPSSVDSGRNMPSKPPKEILDYYFATRGGAGQALGELRLIVVGRPKVGKTSLVKRLRRLPMELDETETHGIEILPLDLECSGRTLHARVWDFGGQHVLHAMHEFFLRSRCLYLLVVEQRTDEVEQDLTYWLQLIRSYAGDAPVVVALNQSKGVERSLAKTTLERDYGPIAAWVATDCAKDEEVRGASRTIEALRKALTAAAAEMPEPMKLFPKKWLEVKKWLEGMTEPYLDYATFARRCADLHEKDPQQQAALAAAMDELGVAMNYARDPRLRDTTVLRPNWLANGIYALLRGNILTARPLAPDGVLTEERVGEILRVAGELKVLSAAEYPRPKWAFLLRLMNLFQLTFPLDEQGERYLVPTLLPAEEPPKSGEPTGPDAVRLRYDFAVVPGPLMGRLIVRLFAFIDARKVWQRGAKLRYGSARARVWSDLKDSKAVFVTVAGGGGDGAQLLEIIREALKEMFLEYERLRVVEQWWNVDNFVPRGALERFGVLPREPEDADAQTEGKEVRGEG